MMHNFTYVLHPLAIKRKALLIKIEINAFSNDFSKQYLIVNICQI